MKHEHDKESVDAIHEEINIALGHDDQHPPLFINQQQAADLLGLKPGTLSVWRCTGRYDLPFTKMGRHIRYSVRDIARFISKNRRNN